MKYTKANKNGAYWLTERGLSKTLIFRYTFRKKIIIMNLLVLIFLGIQSISLLLIAMTAFTACSIYKKQVKNNKNDIEKPNKDD